MEFVWNATHDDPASDVVLLDAGAAWSVATGLQIDVSAIVGLNRSMPAFGITVSFTWGPRRIW